MEKTIFVVYPKTYTDRKGKKRKLNKEKLWEFLEEDGDVESFTNEQGAKAWAKEHNGIVIEEPADEEVYQSAKKFQPK